jgi:hypothetical protein
MRRRKTLPETRRRTGRAAGATVSGAAFADVPARWGVCFYATVTIPLVALFIYPVAPQNGWWWDMLMGAGMLAAGMMIAIPLLSPRVWVYFGGDARALRFVLYVHRDVSYIVLLLTLVHIGGLLVADATLIEYLKLSAPWSMLAANLSAILLLVITVSSWYRIELDLRYHTWRVWHAGLSIAAMALMAAHVIDTGYYVNSPIKKAVFIVLAAGPSLASLGAGGWHALARAAAHGEIAGAPRSPILRLPAGRAFSVRLVGLLAILWLVGIIAFAIPESGSRAERQAHPCAESVCG